jgi:glycosyltransferase involved in cell wall biosynthesis
MEFVAQVVVPTGYARQFNMPAGSDAHEIIPTDFIGRQRKIWKPLLGVALWRPGAHADVIHTFNRIPIHVRRPWMVTFEEVLPRTFGPRGDLLSNLLRRRLVSSSCHRIIAMSVWARDLFAQQHHDWTSLEQALAKTEVVYPALAVRSSTPRTYRLGDVLRAVFVGADWATKGAPVAGRLAKLASDRGLPLEVHVVSALRFAYADDARLHLYDADKALITDGPVTFHGSIPNDDVHRLLANSHLLLLPTLGDTFGYSVLEGFAHGLPAIVSSTCALPEVVRDGDNGQLLKVEQDALGRWVGLKQGWEVTNSTYDSMAGQALEFITSIVTGETDYEALSAGAIQQLKREHDVTARDKRLNDMYSSAGAAT